ncbi:DUF2092 domain-containing protein [Microbulbifer magnicolonia]|uniref:DUF2092 domain-containing protein n=1 Tax=Microbulbifer magnicolonia TaxID=3109744 RepID=UPI002B41296E|nr:DUF2092 domain-containing protein [Microbulbifer sp. GG15]
MLRNHQMGALLLALIFIALSWVGLPASAQTHNQAPADRGSAERGESAVDPASIKALQEMATYLGSLKSIAFDAATFTEAVLDNQQKLLVPGVVRYLAVKPDKLRVELLGESIKRHFYHDGTKFTLVAPREGYFAELDAASSTRDALVMAARDFGIEVPFADLLEWGHTRDAWKNISEGFLVGMDKVDGKETQHWAFRGPNLDWEIWIATGDKPLPLRISTVNTRDPTRPRFVATLKWSEAQVPKAEQFSPALAKELKRIEFKKAPPKQEG